MRNGWVCFKCETPKSLVQVEQLKFHFSTLPSHPSPDIQLSLWDQDQEEVAHHGPSLTYSFGSVSMPKLFNGD